MEEKTKVKSLNLILEGLKYHDKDFEFGRQQWATKGIWETETTVSK